jgi:hypothetical protein
MADTQTPPARTDIDILDDIQRWINTYPPLVNDRRHVQFSVQDGVAHLSGNVKTPITKRYVRENLRQVEGITGVNDSALHDDETIRLALGSLLPEGVIANIQWGNVILSGTPLSDGDFQALVTKIASIGGVQRVVAQN